MSSGSYYPPPVKAVSIPKKSGGVRLLGEAGQGSDGAAVGIARRGIPTVADRVAQTTVKMWLEPRLDPIFRDGYRPGKSALAAIAVTRRRCWDYDWVVEFDIRALLAMTRQTITGWHLQLKSDKSMANPSAMFDPILRGWQQYYGHFHGSALKPMAKREPVPDPMADAQAQAPGEPQNTGC